MQINVHKYGFTQINRNISQVQLGYRWVHGPIEIRVVPVGLSQQQTEKSFKKSLRGYNDEWKVIFYEWGIKKGSLVGVSEALIKNLEKFCQLVSQLDWSQIAILLEKGEL